jgi:alpha-galactosidase
MKITIRYNDKTIAPAAGRSVYEKELYADVQLAQSLLGNRLRVDIHPKEPVVLREVSVEMPFLFEANDKVFCNGFQSWTESREFALGETLHGLRAFAKPWLGQSGDYQFDNIFYKNGHFHSWTYSYVRKGFKHIQFFGSLNEATGFTVIHFDTNRHTVTIRKDCQGLALDHSYSALDLLLAEGGDWQVFDAYFHLMGIAKPRAKPATGWTSANYLHKNISESIVLDNLALCRQNDLKLDYFLIGDGYQTHVGDWLGVNHSFPKGMKHVADAIADAGHRPGLWLAPFVCDKRSNIFKQKKHWLLHNAQGKPLRAGYNAAWGGSFYALDIYHQEVRDYLSGVFHTVIGKWGFQFLKLDFLYAAALAPPQQKTRGHVMHEAVEWLRQLAGETPILASGLPLGAAFGLVDYCCVGANVGKWEQVFLKMLGMRERVSTLNALRSAFGRWQLDGRAFLNCLDVLTLPSEKNGLAKAQRETLLLANMLVGKLHFMAGNIGHFDKDKMRSKFWSAPNEITYIEQKGEISMVYFDNNGQPHLAAFNLSGKVQEVVINGAATRLAAFGSMVVEESRSFSLLEDRPI